MKSTPAAKSAASEAVNVKTQRLSHGELSRLDALITQAQEHGLKPGDLVKFQSDICCCGAVTATTTIRGRWLIDPRQAKILEQIKTLEAQMTSAPTLRELVKLRDAAVTQMKV
ncbi:MAG: hypothetical protein ACKV19_25735 [Verrucomicrobiales bacterium]